MAHFAKLDDNNIVLRVSVVGNEHLLNADGEEEEAVGLAYMYKMRGDEFVWVQTSYNTLRGVHTLGGTPLRKNYAGIGFTYDEVKDAFIPIKPYPSWVLNEGTCRWDAPTAMPDDGKGYWWNESTTTWDEYS